MKLRLAQGSLRLRLDPPDLDRLARFGRVEVAVRLTPARRWLYVLQLDSEAEGIDIRLDGRPGEDPRLVVVVPEETGRGWLSSDDVGLEATLELGPERTRVLVEKDLGCHH